MEYDRGTVWDATGDWLKMHFANLMTNWDSFRTEILHPRGHTSFLKIECQHSKVIFFCEKGQALMRVEAPNRVITV